VKTLVLLSGGLDSCVLAARLAQRNECEVACVSFDYGQRHVRELEAAGRVAKVLGLPREVVRLPVGSLLPSALTSDVMVPRGHYEAESMQVTVVPNRNMIFLSVAAGMAAARGFTDVAFAAHGGDHAIYPDCRPAFAEHLDTTPYKDKKS